MTMLDAALSYHKQGFSVIPCRRDKKPFIKWQEYQETQPTEVEIREWWHKWPNANIAIITGKRSGLTVLDADSEKGKDAIEDMLPESLVVPIAKTPKGWHYYFKYEQAISNGVRVLHDCDVRSEGGYVVAPPSKNGRAMGYEWVNALSCKDDVPRIPNYLKETIIEYNANTSSSSLLYSCQIVDGNNSNKSNICNILSEGRRDNDIFRLANCLIKGGMPAKEASMYLEYIAKTCNPPFAEKEVKTKIDSAVKRSSDRDRATTAEVREWVSVTSGNFCVTNAYQDLAISNKSNKNKVRVILGRLVDEGIIERDPHRSGWFRKVDKELNEINIFDVEEKYLDIKYPLSMHEYFRTMPKNIVVIAGTPNVGKTAFLLNLASLNLNRGMAIRYFTSEMGPAELKARCQLFEPEVPLSFWKDVTFADHSFGFADKFDPDGINIVDFLEMPTEFWLVGQRLTEMYNKLENGIAVVALQKKFGQKLGRGAEFSLEKPRLYVSLESNPPEGNIARIEKCKNRARSDINPNGMECVFNVIQGSKIRMGLRWYHPMSKELKK